MKLADIQSRILTKILKISFARHFNRRSVPSVPADSDSRRIVSAVSHRRSTSGTDPVVSAVVLFRLLGQTFPKHLHQLIKVVFLCPCRHVVNIPFQLALIQPIPEFFRNIVLRLDPLKEFGESHIELIVIRFGLHQHVPAQIIKFHQRIHGQPLVQRIDQTQPFVERNIHPSAAEQIEEINKHVSYPLRHRYPDSFSAARRYKVSLK